MDLLLAIFLAIGLAIFIRISIEWLSNFIGRH
jgi:hypothetical protein